MKKKGIILLLSLGLAGLCALFMANTAPNEAERLSESCRHEYIDQKIEPTCTEKGYTEHLCTLCGAGYKDSYTNETGHDFTKSEFAATCTEKGYILYVCTICGYSYTETETGHIFSEVTTPPTCTKHGYTTYFCEVCGFEYTDNYLPATGHNYTDETVTSTCTERGYTKHTCVTCGYEYRDSYVEAIGHYYHVTTTAAGCETEGYVEYTCAVCGDSYRDEYTAATGHLHNAKIIRPTCVAYGYTEYICETCGDRYVTDYVKPTGHNFTDEVIPAGKDTIGFTKHTCEVCGYHYLSDFVTSGDDGYIPTDPPDPPDDPPAHEHDWVLTYKIHETDKYITLDNACECGEHETAGLQILCTDKFGNSEVLAVTDEGQADYINLSDGEYDAIVIDESGNILAEFILTIEPEHPIPPLDGGEDKPDSAENNSSAEDSEPTIDSTEKPEKKSSLAVTLLTVLGALAIGITALVLGLKLNKATKNKNQNEKQDNKKE